MRGMAIMIIKKLMGMIMMENMMVMMESMREKEGMSHII